MKVHAYDVNVCRQRGWRTGVGTNRQVFISSLSRLLTTFEQHQLMRVFVVCVSCPCNPFPNAVHTVLRFLTSHVLSTQLPLPWYGFHAYFVLVPSLGRSCIASDELKNAARKWIDKLSVKNGTYPPDSYPNPGKIFHHYLKFHLTISLCLFIPCYCGSAALAYHNAQLEASAFREEWDSGSFEDLTEPKYDMIHKVCFSGFPSVPRD